jgi:hypothetical protein
MFKEKKKSFILAPHPALLPLWEKEFSLKLK